MESRKEKLKQLSEKSKILLEGKIKDSSFRYPQTFKDEVLSFIKEGFTLYEVSQTTGVVPNTIRHWMGYKPPKKKSNNEFKEIKVIDNSEITLRWNQGLEISGLKFEQLRALLREELL